MKQSLSSVKKMTPQESCIDEMEALLEKISHFKELINSADKPVTTDLKQEYRLFKQHVEWVIEDLDSDNYVCYSNHHRSGSA
jgi:hypothetical protein